MASHIERRRFLAALAGAAAWPLAARAQQTAMPVIGFLSSRSPGESASVVAGFRQGLKEAGYAEGRNVHIAFRWAEGRYDRLPALAAELVDIQVTDPGSRRYPNGTRSQGRHLDRPDRQHWVTGISVLSWPLTPKRLELMRELMPTIGIAGVLINPNGANAEVESREIQAAARAIGQQIRILSAATEADLHTCDTGAARREKWKL
jgi:putative tryptophan/tyrosine transport system substrate-binding protein